MSLLWRPVAFTNPTHNFYQWVIISVTGRTCSQRLPMTSASSFGNFVSPVKHHRQYAHGLILFCFVGIKSKLYHIFYLMVGYLWTDILWRINFRHGCIISIRVIIWLPSAREVTLNRGKNVITTTEVDKSVILYVVYASRILNTRLNATDKTERIVQLQCNDHIITNCN